MSDPKKPDEDDEFDWNQALAEWDEKSFAPEIARDVLSDKPAAIAGAPAPRPLYRPPTPAEGVPVRSRHTSPTGAPPPAPFEISDDEAGEDADATIIAIVPQELLRGQSPAGALTSRGGLRQLFAREDASARSFGPSRAPAPFGDEVVTSARAVALGEGPDSEPLPPAKADQSGDDAAEGALFDPFARPSRPPLATLPASEEMVARARASMDRDAAPEPPRPRPAVPVVEFDSSPDPLAPPLPGDDDVPSVPLDLHPPRREAPPRQAHATLRSWTDERPATDWLSDRDRAVFQERATWLEDEARALQDPHARARALLACSELRAILGEWDRAEGLASEARDLAPATALAHRQVRNLRAWLADPEDSLEALDAEASAAPTAAARSHAAWLAAEALRARGDADAYRRFEELARQPGDDARAAVACAVDALARGDAAAAVTGIGDSPALAPLARAIEVCARLRGASLGRPVTGGKQIAVEPEPSWRPNEALGDARRALADGDLAAGVAHIAALADVPGLAPGVQWLTAAIGATVDDARRVAFDQLQALVASGETAAVRPLVARAIELGDDERLFEVLAGARDLEAADPIVLAILGGRAVAAHDPRWQQAAAAPGLVPLLAAASIFHAPVSDAERPVAAETASARAEVLLGRKLAARAGPRVIADALAAVGPVKASARGVAIEIAVREHRADEVAAFVESWGASRPSDPSPAAGRLAAALIAERMGDGARALAAYRAAYTAEPTCEAALRAVLSFEGADPIAELNAFADECGDGLRSAFARIEAVARGARSLPDPTQRHLLELAHRAAPDFPLAAWLAERTARRCGDVEEALRWMREHRPGDGDALDAAIEGVREALLLVDQDPDLARERIRDAHAARPDDVGLRELHERIAQEPPGDGARWRERRAATLENRARCVMLLEAAYGYELSGEPEAAFRVATSVLGSLDSSLARIARERAELQTERAARLADEILVSARNAVDARDRREAYERLALVDAAVQHDTSSALLWHRSVLEIAPDHAPSLRHVEHHLIGEGREEELEPIAAGIAKALGGALGEGTAHAELAARRRMRADASRLPWAREMLDLAAAPTEASLWALRLFHAQARVQGDDLGVLTATRRLVDRNPRPLEVATLLTRAGEAALRLGRTDDARALLERAVVEDAGDSVSWSRLAEARAAAGDARGMAEAFEAVARCSRTAGRQLAAWYEAGRRWMDDVKDAARAIAALEAAAAIDLAHVDVFERLARSYAERRMSRELADLLERRAESLADAGERMSLDVWRGRVLLENGDVAGARSAFQAALAQRPDDPGALSAFAELCMDNGDWDSAEQALVRLSRLVADTEEQKRVYARLGELYSQRLVNLARAEVAYREVLKRAPDDVETLERLVEVHKRQNDPVRAAEIQQGLVDRAVTPEQRRDRIIALAAIHERVSHDLRRAERILEAARRDAPQDVVLLRALAQFYTRHQQTPAVNILLDRATTDARRALAAGRVAPESFEIVATAFELRGDARASRAARVMRGEVEDDRTGETMAPAGERAFDGGLDEFLAPDTLSAAVRSLLAKAGDALEATAPIDLRELRATALPPDNPVARRAARCAAAAGIGSVQMFVSSAIGPVTVAFGAPPAVVVGTSIATDDRAGTFLALRAVHLVRAHAAALARLPASEVALAVTSWLKALNPSWETETFSSELLQPRVARIRAALPRAADPDVATLALETAAALDGRPAAFAAATLAWANRVAWLATGDAGAALDAIAIAGGRPAGAPREARDRIAWVARTPEARDLVAFIASEGWIELTRARPDLVAFK